MIKDIWVSGFKSLENVGPIQFAPFTLLFGPSAAGKSNFLDAVQLLSRLASERNLSDALGGPIRGLPIEAFALPPEGLPKLLASRTASFLLGGEFQTDDQNRFSYRAEVAIKPQSGVLTLEDEYLAMMTRAGEQKGEPVIEKYFPVTVLEDGTLKTGKETLRVRRKQTKGSRPRDEPLGRGFTCLSDERYSGPGYSPIEKAREEMSSWRTYYLDPRVSMRAPQPPREVNDVGPLGENLAPYLFRLKEEHPRTFDSVKRMVRTLLPSIEDLIVDLDKKRGVLDVEIVQDGTNYSSRILSEGTLRVIALSCVATNPWGGSVIAFEEPENGVHPRRIELIAEMLISVATRPRSPRQVIVTTHSPVFCGAAIRHARNLRERGLPEAVAFYQVKRLDRETIVERFIPSGPLFDDLELRKALTAPTDDGVFEGILLRGLMDA